MFYATALPHSSCKTILPCLFFGEKIPSCEIVLIATILLCRIHQLSHVRKEIKIQTNAGMFPNGERFVNASVSLWEVCKCTSISLWINVSVYICESRDIYVWISKHISEPLDIYLWITKYICESRDCRINSTQFRSRVYMNRNTKYIPKTNQLRPRHTMTFWSTFYDVRGNVVHGRWNCARRALCESWWTL